MKIDPKEQARQVQARKRWEDKQRERAGLRSMADEQERRFEEELVAAPPRWDDPASDPLGDLERAAEEIRKSHHAPPPRRASAVDLSGVTKGPIFEPEPKDWRSGGILGDSARRPIVSDPIDTTPRTDTKVSVTGARRDTVTVVWRLDDEDRAKEVKIHGCAVESSIGLVEHKVILGQNEAERLEALWRSNYAREVLKEDDTVVPRSMVKAVLADLEELDTLRAKLASVADYLQAAMDESLTPYQLDDRLEELIEMVRRDSQE